jgi:hypothetical protein
VLEWVWRRSERRRRSGEDGKIEKRRNGGGWSESEGDGEWWRRWMR